MTVLSDLTTEELQYLRSKWSSEQTELVKERARKIERLNNRLQSQQADAQAQAQAKEELVHAQAVYDVLVAGNADQALINSQQAVIDGLQAEVGLAGASAAFVSRTDSMQQQMEFDELEFAANKRSEQIAAVDALLAA